MKDPITQEDIQFYPFKYKCVKYTMSFFTFLTMVSLFPLVVSTCHVNLKQVSFVAHADAVTLIS